MTVATTGARGPSRRAVLLAPVVGAVAATAACTSDDDGPEAPPGPHPDVVLADEAAERERRLLAAYDSASALAPALAERLAALRAEHAEHLAALGVPELPTPAPADPSSSPDPVPAPTAPPLPADPPALLAALADLERAASTAHAGAAVRSGRGLAVVLASAAAAEASHVVALA